MAILYFTRKDDGLTIEEFIQRYNYTHETRWKIPMVLNMRDGAEKWWLSLDHKHLTKLSDT